MQGQAFIALLDSFARELVMVYWIFYQPPNDRAVLKNKSEIVEIDIALSHK